jgi:hypothetical protein
VEIPKTLGTFVWKEKDSGDGRDHPPNAVPYPCPPARDISIEN